MRLDIYLEHRRDAHALVQLGLVEFPMVTDWVVMESLLAPLAMEEEQGEQQEEDETRHGGSHKNELVVADFPMVEERAILENIPIDS